MRKSKILAKLRSGKTALTFAISCGFNPKGVEFVGVHGYDGVWIDMEHRNLTDAQLDVLVLASRMADVDAMVRIRKGSYTNYFRPMEAGAAAIMVPHIKSREEAELAVYNTRYPPIGRRGFDNAGPDGGFCFAPPLEYLEHANRETLLIAQIEDPEALDRLDEIIGVEGMDLLFLGPADLSVAMGIPFQFDHPRMQEAYERVAKAAESAGKWWGTVALNPDQVKRNCDQGGRLFNLGGDHGTLYLGMQAKMAEYRSLLGGAL
ncbi:MAG: aldolase [Phycisphaerae bacterium]|nr:aldolase [Phycisphaerae bacterium]